MELQPEYHQTEAIRTYTSLVQKLCDYGIDFVENKRFESFDINNLQREEFAVNSTLHRGVYHPSPVYDIIIGKEKRGRLTKTATPKSNITHRYIYGNEDRIDYVERIYHNQVAYKEYLIRLGDNQTYGVTLDTSGRLAAVTEEKYSCKKIIQFAMIRLVKSDGKYIPYSTLLEKYYYDKEGLLECHFQSGTSVIEFNQEHIYHFSREDGYLCGYRNINPNSTSVLSSNQYYSITKKRKAWFPNNYKPPSQPRP